MQELVHVVYWVHLQDLLWLPALQAISPLVAPFHALCERAVLHLGQLTQDKLVVRIIATRHGASSFI